MRVAASLVACAVSTFSLVTRAANLAPIAAGTVVEAPRRLTYGAEPVVGSLSGGEKHYYEVEVPAGQFLQLLVEQEGVDVALTLREGEGAAPLVEIDRPNGTRGRETLSYLSPGGGTYRLEVYAWERWVPRANYRVRVSELRSELPRDKAQIEAERAVTEGESRRAAGSAESARRAVGLFTRAGELWRSFGNTYEEAVALYGEGWSRVALSESQQAAACFDRSRRMMEEQGVAFEEAIARTGLAWTLLYLGEWEKGLENFTPAAATHRALNNPRSEAIALYGVGWAQSLLGRDAEALETFERSVELRRAARDRAGEALTLSSSGRIKGKLGRTAEGVRDLAKALAALRELKSKRGEAETLSNLGWVYYSAGDDARAFEHFSLALPIRQVTGDRGGEAAAFYGLARVEGRRGGLPKAREHAAAAVDIVESLRSEGASSQFRASYFATVQDYYEFYVDVLMRLGQSGVVGDFDEDALHAHERARARALLDAFSEARGESRRAIDSALLEEEARLRQKLNAAADRERLQRLRGAAPHDSAEIKQLLEELRRVEARIREVNPRYAALSQPRPLAPSQLQEQLLDENTLLLEYALGAERSYVWAVTRESVKGFALPGRAEIEERARKVYESLGARGEHRRGEAAGVRRTRVAASDAVFYNEAGLLGEVLLGPVSKLLPGKRLVVATQGALELLPLGIFPAPGTFRPGQGFAAYVPLARDHEVVNVPSASMLALSRHETARRDRARKAIAVFADPVFGGDDERLAALRPAMARQPAGASGVRHAADTSERNPVSNPSASPRLLPRLSGTRYEAELIAAMAPAGQRLLAVDFAASRAAAAGDALVAFETLHFATHALIDHRHPELSGLVFSQVDASGAAQDGILRSHEIAVMRLSADLAVLSACGTGVGREIRGEGLMSLTRSFMIAGVPRVVVSSWAVPDKESAELMVRFYRKMLGPERPPAAAALRAAQISMWEEPRWRSPYYWGAFALHGEWR